MSSDCPPHQNNLVKSDQRSTRDGPWFWITKAAVEKIREDCEDTRSTLGIYVALCEIASDERSESFIASMDKIAAKSCLTRRTVIDRLKDLERIGVIRIYRSATTANFRVPSQYTLLRCDHQKE
jgi:hypothetical protein